MLRKKKTSVANPLFSYLHQNWLVRTECLFYAMGNLLFGALLFQIKFKIVLKEYASNPRMCVAAYFLFWTFFKKFKHTRKGFQVKSFLSSIYQVEVKKVKNWRDSFQWHPLVKAYHCSHNTEQENKWMHPKIVLTLNNIQPFSGCLSASKSAHQWTEPSQCICSTCSALHCK